MSQLGIALQKTVELPDSVSHRPTRFLTFDGDASAGAWNNPYTFYTVPEGKNFYLTGFKVNFVNNDPALQWGELRIIVASGNITLGRFYCKQFQKYNTDQFLFTPLKMLPGEYAQHVRSQQLNTLVSASIYGYYEGDS